MPFPTRAVEPRQDIPEVYQDNAQNILQKNSVSNLIGLLQQLNQISSYASEIFTDILDETKKNSARIVTCNKRLKNIETKVPPMEQKFVQQSPAYFYDNPFTGKEWQRRDPLRGLLLRRDRCTKEVNRRRNIALPPPNLSALDHLSMSGKCINSYTDVNFFMNEWLEAEKRKMAEEKKNRKEKRKKKRSKRKKQETIVAVAKTKYDPVTGKKIIVKQTDIAVKQYTLSGDNDTVAEFQSNDADVTSKYNQRVSGITKSAVAQMADNSKKSNKKSNKKKSIGIDDNSKKLSHQSMTSYAAVPQNPIQAAAAAAVQIKNNNNNITEGGNIPPPFNPAKNTNNGPPPVPPPFNPGGNNNNNNNNNSGNGPPPVPPPFNQQQGPPPVPVPAEKKKLTGAEMAMLSAKSANDANMYAQVPPNPGRELMPAKSALLLTDIAKGVALKKAAPIKRQIPKDKRSLLMSALRDKNKKLKHVNKEEINKPKEKEVDGTIYEILNRRKIMNYESESSEDDSSWGSEEE